MSEDLEKMYQAFLNNQVPDMWKPKAYASLKSLASWVKDFQLRFNFIRVGHRRFEDTFSTKILI